MTDQVSAPTQPAVLFERLDDIALITLNRPGAMNAVNSALATELGEALEEFNTDAALRSVVITGAGRAFCAGADLKELAKGDSVAPRHHPEWGFAGMTRHYIDKPVIAAVNGFALGGGTEILLACDLAVISEEASVGLPEVKRGLFAAAGGLIRLHQQIPQKIALELALTGEPMSAHDALQRGLVNKVVPQSEVLGSAIALARSIASNAPLAVQASKRIIQSSKVSGSWEQGAWQLNDELSGQILASRDLREGTSAFAEKRPPVWQGC